MKQNKFRKTERDETDHKIEIIIAELFVRKICLHPSIGTSHMSFLN